MTDNKTQTPFLFYTDPQTFYEQNKDAEWWPLDLICVTRNTPEDCPVPSVSCFEAHGELIISTLAELILIGALTTYLPPYDIEEACLEAIDSKNSDYLEALWATSKGYLK